MDNPLAGSDSDSDSDVSMDSDGGNPLANSDSSSSGSDDEPEADTGASADAMDDLLGSLMPTSRIGQDRSDDSDSSDEDEPMTAAQIQAMRAAGASGNVPAAAKRDYLTEIGSTGRVPMMFGTSSGGDTVRIDWQSIGKDDVKLFTDLFHKHVDPPSQFNRASASTAAWLLQHSLSACLELMLRVAKAEEGGGETAAGIEELMVKAKQDGLSVVPLSAKKTDCQPVQPYYCDLTDAVRDISNELTSRMGGTGNLGRIQQLVEGLGAWLDGGADPTEPEAWTGLMARATWSPAMELKGHVLYVDFMEHMKRRKKHVSTEMFELGSHHASQLVSKSTKTRAWLLSHALERHLGALESLMPAGSAQGRSLASTKQSVDAGAIAKAIAAPAELDYGQELVDCVNDVVCEFTARHGRLAQSDGLAGPEMARVDLMVAELGQWLSSGATAAAAARDGHASPWRHSESYVHHDQLSRRWSTVFAQEGAVHQLLDIFDEDDVEALKEKVTRGLPVDIIVDGVSESALMAAAARNASTCTEFLLEQGATVNGTNDDGSTAFHYACAFGSLHCVGVLLKAGCDIEIPDKEGYTGSKLASGEPWDDILDVMTALAENNQWAELDVVVEDQTRVKSMEQMVEAEAERRRPTLDYQSLPPSRWLRHHVVRWMEDAFSWAPDYLEFIKGSEVDGELLVKCDKLGLSEKCGIKADSHQSAVLSALSEQDLWGWE